MRFNIEESYRIKDIARYFFAIIGIMLFLKVTDSLAMFLVLPYALLICSGGIKNAHRPVVYMLFFTGITLTCGMFFPRNQWYFLVLRGSYLFFSVVLLAKGAGFRWPSALQPFKIFLLYLFVLSVTSFLGWAPLISELKMILFLIFIVACIQIVSLGRDGEIEISQIRAVILALAVFFLWGSVAVIPVPSIGRSMTVANYLVYGVELDAKQMQELQGLFNGVTMHSQMLGTIAAMFNAFLLSDYIFNIKRKSPLYVGLLLCVPLLIYMTSSRTAMGTYVMSTTLIALRAVGSRFAMRKRVKAVALSVGAMIFFGALASVVIPSVRDRAVGFILKNGEETSQEEITFEGVTSSRKASVENSWDNFLRSPLYGNGFQVNKDTASLKITRWTQLLSAPVEKGFIITMLLEEGGVIGFGIFTAFVIAAFRTAKRKNLDCFYCLFATFLLTNLGEGSFFSITSIGGISWMLCFAAIVMDMRRNRLLRMQQYQEWLLV